MATGWCEGVLTALAGLMKGLGGRSLQDRRSQDAALLLLGFLTGHT